MSFCPRATLSISPAIDDAAMRRRALPDLRSLAWGAGWLVSGMLALLRGCLLVLAPRSDILTTIEIAAPPASVWAVLVDPDDYPTWNPMIAGLMGGWRKSP